MAPTRPQRQAASTTNSRSGASRPVRKQRGPAKQTTRSQQSETRGSDIENEDPELNDNALALPREEPETQNTIATLEEMSERLGTEVEVFAEKLDRFLDTIQHTDHYDQAYDLVLDFRRDAIDRGIGLAEKIRQEYTDSLSRVWAKQARVSTAESSALVPHTLPNSSTASQIEKIREAHEEADTWELFRIVLEHHYLPDDHPQHDEVQARIAGLDAVHRYTTEDELYHRFTLEDPLAAERLAMKTWLEKTAADQRPDGLTMKGEIDKATQDHAMIWNDGPFNTRRALKYEKRLRTWPAPDSSPLPQLRDIATNELLITSLDPDARTRQGRSVEKSDAALDRALWRMSWEWLRKGASWTEICDWFEYEKEGWRAIVAGRGMIPGDTTSRAAFRQMCFLASQGPCTNEYERAVYGLLGGNFAAIEPVCHTVDDKLFAHYSVNLTHQFDQYLLDNYPDRITQSLAPQMHADSMDPATARQAVTDLIAELRALPETKSESVSPLKIVQSYLLADEAESMTHTVGVAIGALDAQKGAATLIARPQEGALEMTQPEAEASLNPACLRVVVHICILLQTLRHDVLDFEEHEMEDNLIVQYIHELRLARKRDLIPLYASRLQKPRYIATLSAMMPDVTDSQEKKDLLTLMEQKGLDVATIVRRQLDNAVEAVIAEDQPRFTILEPTNDESWPGQVVNPNVLQVSAGPLDYDVSRSLECYLIGPSGFDEAFEAYTFTARKLLVAGNFVAVRLLVENCSARELARTKSRTVLGREFQIVDDAERPKELDEYRWAALRARAATYLELEQLIHAIEAIGTYRIGDRLYRAKRKITSSVPADLKAQFNEVQEAMEPLLSPDGFLVNSISDDEAQDFKKIREIYVTEAIIAYNTVLQGAGQTISRDHLLTSMGLATIVATPGLGLTEVFVQSSRMRELVTSFAYTSRQILVLKNTGKPWRPKQERKTGMDAAIWDISTHETEKTAAVGS